MSGPAVVLTGPEGEEGSLGEGLRALGVAVGHCRLLEAGPPADPEPLRAAVRRLPVYGAIAFASPRAVDALAGALEEAGIALDRERGTKEVLSAGPATTRKADAAGFLVVVEAADGSGAAALLAALDAARYPVAGVRILLPASERARPELAEGLRARGATVDGVPAYSIRPAPGAADRLADLLRAEGDRDGGAAPILVASPSAAEVLAASAGDLPRLPPLVALGGTTAEAMRTLGLEAAAVAARPTAGGVAEAVRGLEEIAP